MPLHIPRELHTMMLGRGEEGKQWIKSLPAIIRKLEQSWQITIEDAFPNCYCNFVAPAVTQEGTPTVVKIGFPDIEFLREVAYLEYLNNEFVPKIIKVDKQAHAILLERLDPATTLTSITDDVEAIQIASTLMGNLWVPAPATHSFLTTDELYQHFLTLKATPFAQRLLPETIIATADQAYQRLQSTREDQILLHGDLHHYNIVKDKKKEWVAIDPSGIIGERGYEVTAFLKNPPNFGQNAQLDQQLKKRIELFSTYLDIDPRRLLLWGQFQSVLAVFWGAEDGTELTKSFIKVATALNKLAL